MMSAPDFVTRRLQLLQAGDFEPVDRMLCDALVYVHSNGVRHDRKAYQAFIRTGVQLLDARLSAVYVTALDACTLVHGRLQQTLRRAGESQARVVDSWISEVWLRQQEWRLLSFQSTRVATP